MLKICESRGNSGRFRFSECYTRASHRARSMITSVRSPAIPYLVAILIVGAAAALTRHIWDFTAAAPALLVLMAVAVGLFIGRLHAKKNRAEQALRERDARLQLVSEQIPGGLWSTDGDLRITSGFGAQSHLLHGAAGSTLFEHFDTTDPGFPPIAAHRRA